MPPTQPTPDLYVVLYLGRFLSVIYEALPFIVLGAVIAGLVEELGPKAVIKILLFPLWVLSILLFGTRAVDRFLDVTGDVIVRQRVLSIALFPLFGILVPMCECGIVVVMRRLLRKGLPLSCCVAYMLAGPIINLIVISSTFVAFAKHENGYAITLLRVVFGYLVAFGTALIVDWQFRRHGNELLHPVAIPTPDAADDEDEPAARRPLLQRLGNITETALHDFTDILLFLILGAVLAAGVGLFVDRSHMEDLSRGYPVVAIVAMMGMAVLLCLCSEADAFVAASFTALAASAKVSFLVLGPMMDLKLFLMYTRVFRFRLIWTIIPAVAFQVLVWSLLTHYAWEKGWLTELDAALRHLVSGGATASP